LPSRPTVKPFASRQNLEPSFKLPNWIGKMVGAVRTKRARVRRMSAMNRPRPPPERIAEPLFQAAGKRIPGTRVGRGRGIERNQLVPSPMFLQLAGARLRGRLGWRPRDVCPIPCGNRRVRPANLPHSHCTAQPWNQAGIPCAEEYQVPDDGEVVCADARDDPLREGGRVQCMLS